MTAITIRNVPEDLRDELVTRAARAGLSLDQYLLWGLTMLVEDPDPNEDHNQQDWLDEVRAHARVHGNNLTIDEILADRDADRR